MTVTTLFTGVFGVYMGEREAVFEVADGSTAGDLLNRLGRERCSRLPSGLWDAENGRFHRSIRLARCGGPVLAGSEALRDGEELLVIFPLAGG
ncbi:MAG: MoaD/ThiS family protein [Actinomycetota bacterium]